MIQVQSFNLQWFVDNFMKLNTDKCHLMVLGRNSNQQVTVNVGNSVIETQKRKSYQAL